MEIPILLGEYGATVSAKGLDRFILRRTDDPEGGIYYEAVGKHFYFQIDSQGPHLRLVATYATFAFSKNLEKPRGARLNSEDYTWDDVRYTLESAAAYLKAQEEE